MSSSLEEYIRLNAFPADFTESSDSPLFFEMLKQVASKTDCVNPHNPLDLSKRERYVYDADFPLCKADAIGLDASQLDLLDELCPPGLCLGDFCRQVFFFLIFILFSFPFSSSISIFILIFIFLRIIQTAGLNVNNFTHTYP